MGGRYTLGLADILGIGKGVADTAASLTQGAANIVTAAKSDPNAELDAELEKLRIETEVKLIEIASRSVDSAREFAVKYEGAATDIQPWLRVVRNSIRPAFSLFFLAQLCIIVAVDATRYIRGNGDAWELLSGLPQGWWVLAGIVLTFWFGGKVIERSKLGGNQ